LESIPGLFERLHIRVQALLKRGSSSVSQCRLFAAMLGETVKRGRDEGVEGEEGGGGGVGAGRDWVADRMMHGSGLT
jgi:hypothetical protein